MVIQGLVFRSRGRISAEYSLINKWLASSGECNDAQNFNTVQLK